MNKLEKIILEIKRLDQELRLAIQQKEEEFYYKIKGKRVLFEAETRRYHKTLKTKIPAYLRHASLLNILTVPIIWFCILPALLMDIAVSLFQATCFRIYRIPLVKRSEYIIIDRHSLSYLNPIEKLNCVYCGYFNGLIAYVQEIAARTEQFWCPIKHARKVGTIHSRYQNFVDYGDHQSYKESFKKIRKDFTDLQK